MHFEELGLAPEILRAVTESGYQTPTPIQQKAIPLVLSGRDLKASAQTGTGKTAAFALPLLQRLLPYANTSPSPARHPIRTLILTPTRELAIQIHESLQAYSRYTHFRTSVVYGGVDIKAQIADLKKGIEFLVATPGRLLDHIEQKTLYLNSVEALVLDEADRMLDMGFIPDIKRILDVLPGQRQSLLFSATFSEEIKKLADTMLHNPELVEVAKRNAITDTITHRVYRVAARNKKALLIHLLRLENFDQVLVFTRTKHETGRLARELARAGLSANAIHGDKTQLERNRALEGFKNGTTKVLVATDVAARGLDIEELPHVINFELPHTPENYIHRIGRTGRAGKPGNAISLVSNEEIDYLVAIEKLIKLQIEQCQIAGFAPDCDYQYPPHDKKQNKQAAAWPTAHNRGKTRHEKQDKHHPSLKPYPAQIPPVRNIAADGFDFDKPYEPRTTLPTEMAKSAKPDLRKPKRVIAALLGGVGKK